MRWRSLKPGLTFVALATVATTAGIGFSGAPAGAATTCPTPTSVKDGRVTWQLRQASGLTTVAASPGVLFTHNDRGLRDNPAPGEDTQYAAVWAVDPTVDGSVLARFRLKDASGNPIPYFDTEAIGTDHEGRIILADTGTNEDHRTTVALYRFTPPVVHLGQPLDQEDVTAEVIRLEYYRNTQTTTPTKLNTETMAIDGSDNLWFVPRMSGMPYSYTATKAALDAAATNGTTLHALRSTQLTVSGPITDASISPNGTTMLIKTMKLTYLYNVTGTVATALKGNPAPCLIVNAATKNSPGFGEGITVDNSGHFFTLAESSKNLHSGLGSTIWSFTM